MVGSVCRWEGKILLCRRAINPRNGFWTLPAGYMELNETSLEGAQREAWEEARASIEIERLLAVYNIPRLSQVQLIYVARLLSPAVEAGPESAEVGLFDWATIPWPDLAFPSVRWALEHYRAGEGHGALSRADESAGRAGQFLSLRAPQRSLPDQVARSLLRHPGESRSPGASGKHPPCGPWIPAFAGMTGEGKVLQF